MYKCRYFNHAHKKRPERYLDQFLSQVYIYRYI